ncbi:hypothetical protein QF002_001025 [Paraburkholderia youngii]
MSRLRAALEKALAGGYRACGLTPKRAEWREMMGQLAE